MSLNDRAHSEIRRITKGYFQGISGKEKWKETQIRVFSIDNERYDVGLLEKCELVSDRVEGGCIKLDLKQYTR